MTDSVPSGRRSICARLSLLAMTTALCSGVAVPAFAQSTPDIPIPPDQQVLDSNGVNLAAGSFNIADVPVAIGADNRGVSYRRSGLGLGWSDTTRYALYQGSSSSVMIAELGDDALTFDLTGGVWVNRDARGATLVSGGSGAYTLTLRDGTVVQFTNSYFHSGASFLFFFRGGVIAVASTIARPNGETLAFSYSESTNVGVRSRLRVQGVKSSNGYVIKIGYRSDVFSITNADWFTADNVKLVNLGSEYCDISANNCTLIGSWPTATYDQTVSGSNTIYTTTDSMGRVTQYTLDGNLRPIAIRRPTSAVDDTSITYDTNGRVASVTVDGRTWTYAFSLSGTVMTATITNPDTSQRVVTSDTTVGLPTSVKDELGKTTTYTYDPNGRLLTTTPPEGNQFKNSYDARGNVTEARQIAKSGSGLADVYTSASYDATCANTVTCNQPNSITDANGNVTNFTYDTTTGGVLTVTAPAPTTGATRPQTRYSYTSYQAYFSNGSAIVASGQPTALLSGISTCQTTASCAGTADEVKTTISYGPQTAGTANTLLPVSKTVAAGDNSLSATTSVAYDTVGNVTSIDGPLAGADDTTTTAMMPTVNRLARSMRIPTVPAHASEAR